MLASRSCTLRAGIPLVKRRACMSCLFHTGSAMSNSNYSTWKAEQLVAKVKALEKDLKEANERYLALATSQRQFLPESSKLRNHAKAFDPSRYSTRMIALKFAYLGRNYNGLEYAAGNITPQPTIEEALWAALMKGRLIIPTNQQAIDAGQVTWEGCDYTKCGRTDKGVSAFGQVVGLRVRSNRPLPGRKKRAISDDNGGDGGEGAEQSVQGGFDMEDYESPPFDPVKDEIPYVHVLNRLLPSDIRALAWCSDLPEDFSARFSCLERRYRYFFTNPAFTPTPGSLGLASGSSSDGTNTKTPRRDGWLDIAAMQDAAKRYEGLHDFRNLCKIDASKQLTDFRRRIYLSEIREVDQTSDSAAYVRTNGFSEFGNQTQHNGTETHFAGVAGGAGDATHAGVIGGPKTYQFILHGSAFLWHQVRHMVAILFLVGQGLEKPDIIDRLLDFQNCPRKPHYEMADDAPLVLWDCIFPDLDSKSRDDALTWIYAGDEAGSERKGDEPVKGKYGVAGIVDSLWEVWRKRRIDEVLAGSLLNLVVGQGKQDIDIAGSVRDKKTLIFAGGDSVSIKGTYIPLMDRPCGEHFEVVNAKYAARKGITPRTEAEVQELRLQKRDKRYDHFEQYVE